MKKILCNKRYSGFVWHLIFALPFVGLSLLFLQFTQGVTWFLISSVLRIVFASTVLFGLVHCIPSWDTYTFLTTGAIGFAFAVIYVKSGNIVLPMVLHFVYDFLIKMAAFVQWRPNPVYYGICDCSDIAYVVMFMVSLVVLIYTPRRAKNKTK